MIELTAALQPLLVGVVLIWAARFKLFSRFAAASARRSALVNLVGEQRVVPVYRALGGVELAIGALLILPPTFRLEGVAATGLTVGFLGYLIYAKRAAPDSSCGCLSAQRAPVSGRSIARAVVLVAASVLLTGWASAGWFGTLADQTALAGTILLVEMAVVVCLSPELDHRWLEPLRQVWVNLTHPLRGGSGVPLLSTVQLIQQSEVFRKVGPLITSDVIDYWDEQEWRMITYTARYQGRAVTAIFAAPLHGYDPQTVRVALVDDATGTTLVQLAGTPVETAAAPGEFALGTA